MGVPLYLPRHKAMMRVWIAEKMGGNDINNLGAGRAACIFRRTDSGYPFDRRQILRSTDIE